MWLVFLKISLAVFQTDINTDMGVETLSGFLCFKGSWPSGSLKVVA